MNIQQQRHGEIPVNRHIDPLPEIHGNIDAEARPQHILCAGDQPHHAGDQGDAEQGRVEPMAVGKHRGQGNINQKGHHPHQHRGHAVEGIGGKDDGHGHIDDV